MAEVECSNTVAAMRMSFSARRCWLMSRPTPSMPSKRPYSSHISMVRSSTGIFCPSTRMQSKRNSRAGIWLRSSARRWGLPRALRICSSCSNRVAICRGSAAMPLKPLAIVQSAL
ncbi:hypothetical protein D3C85_954270 [compost metagenome]